MPAFSPVRTARSCQDQTTSAEMPAVPIHTKRSSIVLVFCARTVLADTSCCFHVVSAEQTDPA